MGDYANCAWCGRRIEKSGWNKLISRNTKGILGRQKHSYCSKQCEMKAEETAHKKSK